MAQRSLRTLSRQSVRRLAVSSQWLDRPRAPVDAARILDVVRQIGCLQLDPISAVARSHQLVLFSRVGPYPLEHIDHLLFTERSLFEYWAHAASIVLTEDYPLHADHMRRHATGTSEGAIQRRAWIEQNEELRRHILDELRERGPLMSRHFEDKARDGWVSSGWTSDRNVNQMLSLLWSMGEIMVVGRSGGQKLWDLTERALPDWTPRHVLSDDERVALAVQKSLRALGVAREKQISEHFIRGRYHNLSNVLQQMEADGRVRQVEVCEGDAVLPGPWYMLPETEALLDRVESNEWSGQTRLLSPFDNLICDRARTEQLFDFYFRIEIYVPKEKRQYGYYVLPILHGDRLIGRIDPQMDRKKKVLSVNNVYAEADATPDAGPEVAHAIEELAQFLGASRIDYGNVPAIWQHALNG